MPARAGSPSMTAARPLRPELLRTCSSIRTARRSPSPGRCSAAAPPASPGRRAGCTRPIARPAARYPQNGGPDVRAYFAEADGTLLDAGDTLRNPAYAEFLRRLAAQGPDALYRGRTAARIVARVHEGELPGAMTLADLAGYRPVERAPLCRAYRLVLVCVPPPPSSGVAVLQLLAILERTDIGTRGPADPQAWFLFAEASRLIYADRDQYVGDPAFVSVPVAGLLDPAYVAGR